MSFKYIYAAACFVFMVTAPFSLGILASASKITEERENLKRFYKIFRNIALVSLLLVLLILARYDYLGPDSE